MRYGFKCHFHLTIPIKESQTSQKNAMTDERSGSEESVGFSDIHTIPYIYIVGLHGIPLPV